MGDILGIGITHYPGFRPLKPFPFSLTNLLKDPGFAALQAGAMAELKRKPDTAVFIETNVMNSNKVVATFRP